MAPSGEFNWFGLFFDSFLVGAFLSDGECGGGGGGGGGGKLNEGSAASGEPLGEEKLRIGMDELVKFWSVFGCHFSCFQFNAKIAKPPFIYHQIIPRMHFASTSFDKVPKDIFSVLLPSQVSTAHQLGTTQTKRPARSKPNYQQLAHTSMRCCTSFSHSGTGLVPVELVS